MARKRTYGGRKAGKKNVSMERFLKTVARVAVAGGTQSEAAAKLGLTPAAVSLRCKLLREKGVNVPAFSRASAAGHRIDVAACNELLRGLVAAK